MEVLEVALPTVVHGDRISAGHVASMLSRGLDFGEEVLVHTGDGEYHLARVEQVDFELEDTVYTLAIGARMPVEMVMERLSGALTDPEVAERHHLVSLLGELDRTRAGDSRD